MPVTIRSIRSWIDRTEGPSLLNMTCPSALDLLQHMSYHLFKKQSPTPKCLLGISGFCALLPSAAGMSLADLLASSVAHAQRQLQLEAQRNYPDADGVWGDFALRRSLSSTLSEWTPDTSMPSPQLR